VREKQKHANFRIPQSDYDKYQKICEALDETVSQSIRKHFRDKIAEHKQLILFK